MGKWIQKPVPITIILGVVIGLLVLGVREAGLFHALEMQAYDWFVTRGPRTDGEARTLVVAITEEDIQSFGQWPISDALLARTLEKVTRYGPRAIGLDIYRDFSIPPGEEALENVLAEHPTIVAAMKFGQSTGEHVPPPPVLRETDRVGFNDLLIDQDGVVRRGLLFLDDGRDVAYAFALQLALLYLAKEGIAPQPDPGEPRYVRLGPVTIRPLDADEGGYVGVDAQGYQFLLDYRGPRQAVPTVPVRAVLADQIDPEMIRDKIVLIGVTATSIPDRFHTAYSSDPHVERGGIPGVQVHASMVDQLIRAALKGDAPTRGIPENGERAWILLWGMVAAGVGWFGQSSWRIGGILAGGLAVVGGIGYLLFLEGWWVPVVPAGVAWVAAASVVAGYRSNIEHKQHQVLKQLFSRHVSPEIARTIWEQREAFLDGGRPRSQRLVATVLFADLESFTPVSEKLEPQALMDWTNRYIDLMAAAVMTHDGVVDDYFGDGLKANFGVPFPSTSEEDIRRDAANAVRCALRIQAGIERLNQDLIGQGAPAVRVRLGLQTGPVVAGSLGSAQRLKYTTVGDTVNVAARLQAYANGDPGFGGNACRILLGESTFYYVEQIIDAEPVGRVTLKGKTAAVTAYRVVCLKEAGLSETHTGEGNL